MHFWTSVILKLLINVVFVNYIMLSQGTIWPVCAERVVKTQLTWKDEVTHYGRLCMVGRRLICWHCALATQTCTFPAISFTLPRYGHTRFRFTVHSSSVMHASSTSWTKRSKLWTWNGWIRCWSRLMLITHSVLRLPSSSSCTLLVIIVIYCFVIFEPPCVFP